MSNFFEIASTVANISRFFDISRWRSERSRGSNSITVPNFVEIARTQSEILKFFDFLRWRPPPCWISTFQIFYGRKGQEGRNASMRQISSKSFEPQPRYVSFNIMIAWLENAYSRPFCGVFWGTFPPDDVSHHPNPKKGHSWAEPRQLSHKPRILSY